MLILGVEEAEAHGRGARDLHRREAMASSTAKKMKIGNPELYDSFNLAVICLLSEKLVFMTKRNELMK